MPFAPGGALCALIFHVIFCRVYPPQVLLTTLLSVAPFTGDLAGHCGHLIGHEHKNATRLETIASRLEAIADR